MNLSRIVRHRLSIAVFVVGLLFLAAACEADLLRRLPRLNLSCR